MSIHISRLSKRFPCRSGGFCALDGIDLTVTDGEMVALIGPSGSGKSTLLRLTAGLIAGDAGSGSIEVDGRQVQEHGRIANHIRDVRAGIGVVFQQFNLVGRLSVLDNVLAGGLHRHPLWRTLGGWLPQREREYGMACLHRVGMSDKASQRAATLSGGQQQRVAIARTLFQGARTILADEPIASLDPTSAQRVMELLAGINREDGVTVVVSLHQVDYARGFCPRTVAMRAGRIVFDGATAELDDQNLHDIYDHESEPERPATVRRPRPVFQPALATA